MLIVIFIVILLIYSYLENKLIILLLLFYFLFGLQIEVMKGNVKTRVNTYLQELEKFKARWDQLKPSDDVIETGHPDVLQRSAEIIKEKKIELDELEDIKQKLVYVYFCMNKYQHIRNSFVNTIFESKATAFRIK